jgi:Domain of unknown function (DUF4352)
VSSSPIQGLYPDPPDAPRKRHWDGWHRTGDPPAATPRRVGLWVALSIVTAVVLFFGGCTALMAAGSQSPAPTVRDRVSGPGVPPGTPVRDGPFEFVVSGVTKPSPVRGDPLPRGQWVVATVTVRNLGGGAQQFHVNHQKLVDSAGHTYAGDAQAAVAMNKHSMVIEVTPSSTITMKLPFDVPAGTLPATIELHDSVFSGGARVQVN